MKNTITENGNLAWDDTENQTQLRRQLRNQKKELKKLFRTQYRERLSNRIYGKPKNFRDVNKKLTESFIRMQKGRRGRVGAAVIKSS